MSGNRAALIILLTAIAVMCLSSCSKQYDPLFNQYTIDHYEQEMPDGSIFIFKDTMKYDYTMHLYKGRSIQESMTGDAVSSITLLLEEPDWSAKKRIPASLKNDYMKYIDRWAFKNLFNDKPTTVSLVSERAMRKEIRSLRPVYQTKWDVTEFKKGSGLMRLLVGFNTGAVKVKIAGDILDPEGNTVADFIITSKEAGLAVGGWNYRVYSWKYCAKLMAPTVGKAISDVLIVALGAPTDYLKGKLD